MSTEPPQYSRYAYLGLQMGYGIGEREVHLPQDIKIEGKGGITSAINGGWFFNRHWGIGGKLSISQVTPELPDDYFGSHPYMKPLITRIETHPMTYTTLTTGALFDHRLTPGLHIGGSIMPGIGWGKGYRINVLYKGEQTVKYLIESNSSPIANLDFSAYLLHTLDNNLGFRIYLNHNIGKGKGEYHYYAPEAGKMNERSGRNNFQLHHFNVGVEIDALLWK